MTQSDLADLIRDIFEDEIMFLREQGQQEYAREDDNAFANFERVADDLDMDRKEVLWVYAMKHRDGIASYIQGHESQREDVRGRINDLIVYLFLLRGMIEEEEARDILSQPAINLRQGGTDISDDFELASTSWDNEIVYTCHCGTMYYTEPGSTCLMCDAPIRHEK